MGKYLQIRVTATTYDPVETEKALPRLYALAWPVEATASDAPKGLLELTQALDDRVRLGELPQRAALLPGVARAMEARSTLETALGNRDPQAADRASYALEDALAELEKIAPKA